MANALKKLGEAALKPLYRDGSWRKPKCSARIAADLKKEALASGREWPIPEKESKQKRPFGQYKAPKGHKHEKQKQQRLEDIAKNMADMPKKIAAYRESRKLKPASLLDTILCSTKELRMKQYRNPNTK